MAATTTKMKVMKTLNELPQDATLEDFFEHLFFLHKVEQGLAQARAGQGIAQNEVEVRMKKWQP